MQRHTPLLLLIVSANVYCWAYRWNKITCDQIPTLHRGFDDGEDVCVEVCLLSSHGGTSHTSLVGRIFGSMQAPSAILIVNDGFTSWTHSSSRVRTPAPQETEHSLHGPPRHLQAYIVSLLTKASSQTYLLRRESLITWVDTV